MTFEEFLASHKGYQQAAEKSLDLAYARGRLPPGSTRARVTTANARWAQAAEGRDKLKEFLQREFEAGNVGGSRAEAPPVPRAVPAPIRKGRRRSGPPPMPVSGATIQIGRHVYRVETKPHREGPEYHLHGPRGAHYRTMRNVHSPSRMFLVNARGFGDAMQGVWLTDDGGKLRVF